MELVLLEHKRRLCPKRIVLNGYSLSHSHVFQRSDGRRHATQDHMLYTGNGAEGKQTAQCCFMLLCEPPRAGQTHRLTSDRGVRRLVPKPELLNSQPLRKWFDMR